jgi:hypothetical protein
MASITRTHRVLVGTVAATAVLAAGLAMTTLKAEAVSGGGYDPAQQGCSKTANRNDRPQSTEKGCHNATLQINSGSGDYRHRSHLLSVNTDQLPDGQSLHAGSVAMDPGMGTQYVVRFDTGTGSFILLNPLGLAIDLATWVAGGGQGPPPIPQQILGTPAQPSAGADQSQARKRSVTDGATNQQVYFGADDNLDNGEHDGVNPTDYGGRDARVANGPSDGGAAQVNTHLQGDPSDPASLLRKNVDPTDMHNPLRAADAGTGACADGLCAGADTTRRKAYQGGCRSCADQSVYNDQNSTNWRSPDCNGQSTANQNKCGAGWRNGNPSGNIYQPWSERGAYYTDPGVFVYEDPDPQASPLGSQVQYPICELYAGTMGVWVCSQNVVPAPPTATPPSGDGSNGGGGNGGQRQDTVQQQQHMQSAQPGTSGAAPHSAPATTLAAAPATQPISTPALPALPTLPIGLK